MGIRGGLFKFGKINKSDHIYMYHELRIESNLNNCYAFFFKWGGWEYGGELGR